MIDFHSHLFSYPFFEALAAQSPLPGSVDDRLAGVAARAGLELPARDLARHWERWRTMLDQHEVDHLVSFASLPDEVPAVAEVKRLAAGRVSTFALVNPSTDGAVVRTRGLLTTGGFAGVLLFPAMHRFDPAGAAATAVYEVLDELGAIAVVHCGLLQVKLRDLLGLPRQYDFTLADPLRLIPAAQRFERVRFVIPHFGAGMFRETLMAGSLCDNLFVDTSSSNAWIKTQPIAMSLAQVFERAMGVFGPRRILFGTDSSTLPRGWRRDLLDQQLAAMAAARVEPADQARILDGNARQLLGLPGA